MTKQIAARGPDSSGSWTDHSDGIAIGHTRLAIQDLTSAGSQPMMSNCSRYIIAFNGEIYNHLELRKFLGDTSWSGHSDTETLLMLISKYGIRDTLAMSNGMFAFVLWDKLAKRLTLARDRFGEKPLYYGFSNSTFFFGSQLKSFFPHPHWKPEINFVALNLYLRHSYVPDPHCIYKGISKLLPGTYICYSPSNGIDKLPPPITYWTLSQHVNPSTSILSHNDIQGLLTELEVRLLRSVSLRTLSDVPIGSFLSGGIDSSLITALMQSQSSVPVNTYTIGFEVPGYNEADSARSVASCLGSSHTEYYLTPHDVLAVVPCLSSIWDEPFADSSQIPTLLLSRLTQQDVKVVLSGDGGDETFCGYNRYLAGYSLFALSSRLPPSLRRLLSKILKEVPAPFVDNLIRGLLPLNLPAIGDRLNKLANIISMADASSFYRSLVSIFPEPNQILSPAFRLKNAIPSLFPVANLLVFQEQMMLWDSTTYLPGDILVKVDRATMSTGLEARCPFLDHNLVEWAWSLPFNIKARTNVGKWCLRQILYKYVPQSIVDRPKQGFGLPIDHWLSGELRSWCDDMLSYSSLSRQGIFDADSISRMWQEHCLGKRRWHHQLWNIIMFQSWYHHWMV